MNQNDTAPETDEPDLDGEAAEFDGPLIPEPPHPINWNLLTSEEAEAEWLELNRWVRLAPPHLRAACFGDSAVLAPPPGAVVGAERSAPALAVRLRPGAERLRTAGLASRLRRRPPAASRLGRHFRHPSRPRPPDPADGLARRGPGRPRSRTRSSLTGIRTSCSSSSTMSKNARRQEEDDFYAVLSTRTPERVA
jgi:hypothetical protein